MSDPAQLLSNPAVAVSLRGVLGAYVIYMARKFYADPTGYFRKSSRGLLDLPWLGPIIRALACFCLWGGCFIVATAIAVQILGLHGDLLALALVTVSGIATWLLLPKRSGEGAEDQSSVKP
jgi:hypothetical protein